ncbi:Protein-lysine N-methyltransferase EFM5 [Pleurostoma richardsiae]|uniref:Protein-lysine N-methyltransferase EFM5 n=1 Tax=Pleurostoma richardsiae TaxID=41990 RepID=A0AA38R612_9PEZI|nr:Protein-lysine N-methyltransferase EFM5 [Pleurostoma richardsiae]
MANESDDEPLTLSSHALDALKDFYADRDARAKQFEQLKAVAEDEASSREQQPLSMEAFTEDWNESQFWYSDETATLLAQQLLDDATADSHIAVVSAPSVFVALKNALAGWDRPKPKLTLLEHDNRFAVFPEFVFYDFMQPVKLPGHLKGSVDRIICDPPFLSEDCQTKAALTVRWLYKSQGEDRRLIVCTGERMETLIVKLYRSLGVKTVDYEPVHARGLSNEFYCYANFECDKWKWREAPGSAH